MTDENQTTQRGSSKSGILTSVRASVGALNLSGDPGEREQIWRLWKARFERAVRWMDVSNQDKLDLMLLAGGEELQKIIETLPHEPTDYNSHLEVLDKHFKASRNNTLELYKLFNTEWPIEMYFSDFEAKCREQGRHCDFPISLDQAIVMLTTVKTHNRELRNEIIRKDGDLKAVRELAKAYEIAKEGNTMIVAEANNPKEEPEIKKITKPGRYSSRNKDRGWPQGEQTCSKCGNKAHSQIKTCPANGKRCLKCGGMNHFARMCIATGRRSSQRVNQVESDQAVGIHYTAQGEENAEEAYAYQINSHHSNNPTVELEMNGIPITLHVDTQADVTVITEKHFKLIRNSALEPTKVTVRGYSGEGKGPGLPILGRFKARLSKGNKAVQETVYVVRGQGKVALLSRQAAENLGLIEYHLEATTITGSPGSGENRESITSLVEEYKDVFTGIGKLKGVKVKLHVDPDAKGVIQRQRRISIPLKDKFEKLLSKWEDMDIIEDVGNEPTVWCSNVVITPKKDGESIRASLDMTDANQYIKRTRHAIPTLRELEARLNGAKHFSHLDMNDGYMQLELAEESRKLTTFYTPRGLKRFKRLHFGVNSAAEIFNEEVRKVVAQEPNAISIYDDILIFGKSQEEHDRSLRNVLQLWRNNGLTLSLKKSRFDLPAVKFFGKMFTREGISPDPEKVAALQTAGPPKSAAEVRSFLFFAGANADFMEGFAQVTAPLRGLMKKDSEFRWTKECQQSFESVKALLSGDTVMAYFDPKRKTQLKTDAGPNGIAVTLKQYDTQVRRWRPITYRSRALTEVEQRYSQLEKEAKAVEWGILANQIYLYGLRDAFRVDTDHKPLVPLLTSHRATAPLRVERMRIRLQGFNFHLNYVPGKNAGMENNEADFNSRHPEPTCDTEKGNNVVETEFELKEPKEGFEKDIMAVVRESVPEAVTVQELQQQTEMDPELSELKDAIARGYLTAEEKKLLGALYDPVFTELAVVGGLVVRGARIVVPRSLREKVVQLAHAGHQGITKTKEYLRSRLWFPGLDRMVEAHIQHCHPCQVVTVSQDKEPLRMSHMPSETWQEVAVDFWGPIHTGEYLLVVVCKQSRWVEVEFVSGTSAKAVVPKLDRMFAALGIPVTVGSDNGPPFNGGEFRDFSKYLGFNHQRKTPMNPQANGEAEQFMRILKKVYQITRLTGANYKQEVYRFLRAYRATPHCTTKIAPADIMYPNRKFRTRLPASKIPRELDFEELYQRDWAKKMQMKSYADRKRQVKTSEIQVGDPVLVRKQETHKGALPYERQPLMVQYRKGSQVVAQRKDGSRITRSTTHFKKVPYRSEEEAKQWLADSQGEIDNQLSPRKEIDGGNTENPLTQSDFSERKEGEETPTNTQEGELEIREPGQAREEELRRSERQRKDTAVYLREKYPGCVLEHNLQ